MAIHIQKIQQLDSIYESIKFQIVLEKFLKNLSLSDSDIEILSVLYVHGVTPEAITLLEQSGLYKNPQSIKNTLTKLGKQGYIIKDSNTEVKSLSDKLNIRVDKQSVLMTLKIGNR